MNLSSLFSGAQEQFPMTMLLSVLLVLNMQLLRSSATLKSSIPAPNGQLAVVFSIGLTIKALVEAVGPLGPRQRLIAASALPRMGNTPSSVEGSAVTRFRLVLLSSTVQEVMHALVAGLPGYGIL